MKWSGSDYNEKRFNGARNMIVDVYLHGVKGVSPVRTGHARDQIDPGEADRLLQKATAVYAELAAQHPPRSARLSHDSHVRQLGDLIEKVTAVRSGAAEQKMTDHDYTEYRRSLENRFERYR